MAEQCCINTAGNALQDQEWYRVSEEIRATKERLEQLCKRQFECNPSFIAHPFVLLGRAVAETRGAPIDDASLVQRCIDTARGDHFNAEMHNMRVPTFRNWPIAFVALHARAWPLVRALYDLGTVDWRRLIDFEYNHDGAAGIAMQPLRYDEGAFLRPLFVHMGLYRQWHVIEWMIKARVAVHVLEELHALGCVFWDGKCLDTPIRAVARYSHVPAHLEFFMRIGVDPVLADYGGRKPIEWLGDEQFWTDDMRTIHRILRDVECL